MLATRAKSQAYRLHKHNHKRNGEFHSKRLCFLFLIIREKAFHFKTYTSERTEKMTAINRLQTEQVEDIKHWSDIWLRHNKSAGFVTVTDFNKQFTWYGQKDKPRIVKDTKGKPSQFISLNAFDNFSRKAKDLKQIRMIGVDIDQYDEELTIPEALDVLNDMVRDNLIPKPNLVITSRGIQIFYDIHGGASPNMSWLTSYITEQYIAKLARIGADGNAKDVSRVMRVPESINERNGATVHPEIWHKTPYTLQELQSYCKPLNRFKNSHKRRLKTIYKPDNNLLVFYRVNHARLSDLETLIELRQGNFTNKRNVLLYMYAYHQSLIFDSLKDTMNFMGKRFEEVYSTSDSPMSNKEFTTTVKSAYKGASEFFEWYKANGYKMKYELNDGIIKPYKTSNIITMLDITKEEQKELKTLISDEVKAERERQRQTNIRRSKGMKRMSEYQQQRKSSQVKRVEKLTHLMGANPDMTQKELANELGVARMTVSRWIKQYNL